MRVYLPQTQDKRFTYRRHCTFCILIPRFTQPFYVLCVSGRGRCPFLCPSVCIRVRPFRCGCSCMRCPTFRQSGMNIPWVKQKVIWPNIWLSSVCQIPSLFAGTEKGYSPIPPKKVYPKLSDFPEINVLLLLLCRILCRVYAAWGVRFVMGVGNIF